MCVGIKVEYLFLARWHSLWKLPYSLDLDLDLYKTHHFYSIAYVFDE